MISIDSVVKQYSPSVRIGEVSLDIPTGGITALVGPNGAGKSTILTMIGRLLGIDEGTIEVGGLNVATTKSSELARTLSILRQENHFISRLTVRQLVGFGRFPHSKGRLSAEDEAIIDRYIGFLGLEELEGRYLDQLSCAPSGRKGAGASSTSFWLRRCTEQSRVEMTWKLPSASRADCVST